MNNKQRQSGFSLLEVLFAVMLLTVGLIFVASQFPIALANSRTIAQNSTATINAHNAAATLKISLQNEIDNNFITIGPNPTNFLNSDGYVHFLMQPNYRWNTQDFVVDEAPEFRAGAPFYNSYFTIGYPLPTPGPLTYHQGAPPANQIPTYLRIDDLSWNGVLGRLLNQNIGFMVNPAVTGYDKEVEKIMRDYQPGGPIWPPSMMTVPQRGLWDIGIFDVASRRNTSWCAFYQCMDPGGRQRTFRFFILTLELGKDNPHYVIQDKSYGAWHVNPSMINDVNQVQDRMFPIPWYIRTHPAFAMAINPSLLPIRDRIRIQDHVPPGYVNQILMLLRPGSVIIDANNAYVYKITEILDLPGAAGGQQIRFDRELERYRTDGGIAYFWNFWVIPPAINPTNRNEFADRQPVIQVHEEVIQF